MRTTTISLGSIVAAMGILGMAISLAALIEKTRSSATSKPEATSAVGDYELAICVEDAGDELIVIKADILSLGQPVSPLLKLVTKPANDGRQCVMIPPQQLTGNYAGGTKRTVFLSFPDAERLDGKQVVVITTNTCPGVWGRREVGEIDAERGTIQLPPIHLVEAGDLVLWPRTDPYHNLMDNIGAN